MIQLQARGWVFMRIISLGVGTGEGMGMGLDNSILGTSYKIRSGSSSVQHGGAAQVAPDHRGGGRAPRHCAPRSARAPWCPRCRRLHRWSSWRDRCRCVRHERRSELPCADRGLLYPVNLARRWSGLEMHRILD